MSVWHPERGTYRVYTIASEEEHVGNKIAEGRMQQNDFWPHMARYYRDRSKRAELGKAEIMWAMEARSYASGWVARWLEDTAAQAQLEQSGW